MSTRIKIEDVFSHSTYASFLEYCNTCNHIFLDELSPVDFIAYKTKYDVDPAFIKQLKGDIRDFESGSLPLPEDSEPEQVIVSSAINEQGKMLVNDSHELSEATHNPIIEEETALEDEDTILAIPSNEIEFTAPVKVETIESLESVWDSAHFMYGRVAMVESIYSLNISVRSTNALINSGIKTIPQLMELDREELSRIRSLGTKSITEILAKIEELRNKFSSLESRYFLPNRGPMVESINSLNLSVRSTNALINSGIKNISQLMELDLGKLSHIRSLGTKSVTEILTKIDEIKKISSPTDYDFESETIIKHHITPKCKEAVKALLLGEPDHIEIESLSLEEQRIVDNASNAIDCIGSELALKAYTTPEKVIPLMKSLTNFCIAYGQEKQLLELYNAIPMYRRSYLLNNYIKAFIALQENVEKTELNYLLQPQQKVSDLKSIISEVCKNRKSKEVIIPLLKLMQTDLRQVFTASLTNNILKDDRTLYVLRQRSTGLSLETIGMELGITRERVRQLEKKGIRLLHYNIVRNGIDPLMFICADKDGDFVLTIQEIKEYFGDFPESELFIYYLHKRNDSPWFTYDNNRKLFHLKGVVHNEEQVTQIISDLPQLIFSNKVSTLLTSISEQYRVPLEILQIEFNRQYNNCGKVFHKGRLVASWMYEIILKTYYPSGIKLYDEAEAIRFIEKVKEVFGDVKISINTRAFSARIAAIAVLCDRGTYIHPSYIKIPYDLIEKIDNYVFGSERSALSVHELFEKFRGELQLYSNISNHYYLQGVLRYFLGNKYYFTRELISKEKDQHWGSELEAFIRERGEVYKSEIFFEFQGITEIMLSMKVSGNRKIIALDNGRYMHSDLLNLQNEDYTIRKIIEEEVKNLPVSSRKLLEHLWLTHSDFLLRNDILTHSKLFGILRYMFEGEFSFTRPYIAKLDVDNVSNLSVIKQHLQDYDSISISELMSICAKNHLRFLTVRGLIRQLNDEFLRIDSDMLIRVKNSSLTDDAFNQIETMLLEDMSAKGYIVLARIDNYIFYPEVGFSWNPFLLRSIIEKYFSEDIRLVDIPTSDSFLMNTILVDPQLDVDNYEELLSSILKSENNHEPFFCLDDIVNWLEGEGLVSSDPPKCLERIVSIDEYGEVMIN